MACLSIVPNAVEIKQGIGRMSFVCSLVWHCFLGGRVPDGPLLFRPISAVVPDDGCVFYDRFLRIHFIGKRFCFVAFDAIVECMTGSPLSRYMA